MSGQDDEKFIDPKTIDDMIEWGASHIERNGAPPTENDLEGNHLTFSLEQVNQAFGSWDGFVAKADEFYTSMQEPTLVTGMTLPPLHPEDETEHAEERDEEGSGLLRVLMPETRGASVSRVKKGDDDFFSTSPPADEKGVQIPKEPARSEHTRPFGAVLLDQVPEDRKDEILAEARRQGAIVIPGSVGSPEEEKKKPAQGTLQGLPQPFTGKDQVAGSPAEPEVPHGATLPGLPSIAAEPDARQPTMAGMGPALTPDELKAAVAPPVEVEQGPAEAGQAPAKSTIQGLPAPVVAASARTADEPDKVFISSEYLWRIASPGTDALKPAEEKARPEESPLELIVEAAAPATASAKPAEDGHSLFSGEDDVYAPEEPAAKDRRFDEEVTKTYRPEERPAVGMAVPAPSAKAAPHADDKIGRMIDDEITSITSSHSTALEQRLEREKANAAAKAGAAEAYSPQQEKKPEAEGNAEEERPQGWYARFNSWRDRRAEEKKKAAEEKAKEALARQKEEPVEPAMSRRKKAWIYGGVAAGVLALGLGIGGYLAMRGQEGRDTSRHDTATAAAVHDTGAPTIDSSVNSALAALHTASDAGSGSVAAPEPDSGHTSPAGPAAAAGGDGEPETAPDTAGGDAVRKNCNLKLEMHFDSTNYVSRDALDALSDYLVGRYTDGVRHITIYAHRSMEDREDFARSGHPVLNDGRYNTDLGARSGAKALRDAQRLAAAAGLEGLEFDVENLSETDIYAAGTAERELANNRGVTFSPVLPNPETHREAAEELSGCEDSVPCGEGCVPAGSTDGSGSGRIGSLDSHGSGAGQAADSNDVLIDGADDIPVYADLSGLDSPDGAVQAESQDDIPIYVEVMLSDKYGIPIFGDLAVDEVISRNSRFTISDDSVVRDSSATGFADAYDNNLAKECLKMAGTINREYRHTLFGQQYGNALSKGNFSAEFEAKHGFACPDGVASDVYTLMAACMGDELVSRLRQLFAEKGMISVPGEAVTELDYGEFEVLDDDGEWVMPLGDKDYEPIEDSLQAYGHRDTPPPIPAQYMQKREISRPTPVQYTADAGNGAVEELSESDIVEMLDDDGEWVTLLHDNDYEPIEDYPQAYGHRDIPPPIPQSYAPNADDRVIELSEADIEPIDEGREYDKDNLLPLPGAAASADVRDALAELLALEDQRTSSDPHSRLAEKRSAAEDKAEIDRMFDELMAYEAEREQRYAA
ncbi:hypothetical protein JW898_01110 [Candidatus Woesearchaeota archaeon]|nr:hypothetical protein [Candidatus Woesearchaeota archaeon]